MGVKQWWIVKGEHDGDWNDNSSHFYSSVLNEDELKSLIARDQEHHGRKIQGMFTHVVEYSEYEKLKKEVEHYRNDVIVRLEAGEIVNAYCANPGFSATIKGFIP